LFGGFQSNGFQRNAFQIIVSRIVYKGFGDIDYKKYRKYLERLNGITAKDQITPAVIEAAEVLTEIPVATKQISRIADQKKDIDFAKIHMEMARIQDYLNRMELRLEQLRERDDELALLLLI